MSPRISLLPENTSRAIRERPRDAHHSSYTATSQPMSSLTSGAITGARLPARAILARLFRSRRAAHSMAANMATVRMRSVSGMEKLTPACWNASFAVHSPLSIFRIASTSSAPCRVPGAKMQASNAPVSFPPVIRRVTVFELTSDTITSPPSAEQTSYAIPIFSGLDWWEYALNRGSVGDPR